MSMVKMCFIDLSKELSKEELQKAEAVTTVIIFRMLR